MAGASFAWYSSLCQCWNHYDAQRSSCLE
jgi:hypothetical protein